MKEKCPVITGFFFFLLQNFTIFWRFIHWKHTFLFFKKSKCVRDIINNIVHIYAIVWKQGHSVLHVNHCNYMQRNFSMQRIITLIMWIFVITSFPFTNSLLCNILESIKWVLVFIIILSRSYSYLFSDSKIIPGRTGIKYYINEMNKVNF